MSLGSGARAVWEELGVAEVGAKGHVAVLT